MRGAVPCLSADLTTHAVPPVGFENGRGREGVNRGAARRCPSWRRGAAKDGSMKVYMARGERQRGEQQRGEQQRGKRQLGNAVYRPLEHRCE